MADGRMLKKKISKSRKLAALPSDSDRMFYTWLIPHLDVEGRMLADPYVLKGDIVPRLKEWTSERVQQSLETLGSAKLIILYSVDGDQYLELKRFKDEQRLDPKREAKSQCPMPPTKRKPLLKADYDYLWDTWKKGGMICPECGRKAEFVAERGLVADGYIPFHIDHIIPISKGGTNNRENLRVVCRECNLKKGNDITPELIQRTLELPQSSPAQVKLREDKLSKDIQVSPALLFPLKDGTDYPLELAKISEYEKTYHNIDVQFELKKCLQWDIDHVDERKTERGILKHINFWLSGASNSKGPGLQAGIEGDGSAVEEARKDRENYDPEKTKAKIHELAEVVTRGIP